MDARFHAVSGTPFSPVLLRRRPARVLSGQPATARPHMPRGPLDPLIVSLIVMCFHLYVKISENTSLATFFDLKFVFFFYK